LPALKGTESRPFSFKELYNFKSEVFSLLFGKMFIVTRTFSDLKIFSSAPKFILSVLKKNLGLFSVKPWGIETTVPVISEFNGARLSN